LISFFHNVGVLLNSGGVVIFDAWNGSACRHEVPNPRSEVSFGVDDKLIISSSRTRTNLMTGLSELETSARICTQDFSEVESIDYTMLHRLWTPDLIQDIADMSGLAVREILATKGYRVGPTVSDYNLTFVLEKK
jgi:hypothetical protein